MMCSECRHAGEILTRTRDVRAYETLARLGAALAELRHTACAHPASCTCQHRVTLTSPAP